MTKSPFRKARYLIAGVLGAAGLSVAAGQDNPAYISPGATSGERLYVKNGCYQCHGLAGQGSVLSGPALVPLRLTGDAFARYVRNPTRTMPPYSNDHLADSELREIEHYIRSFPQPRSPEDIPLLAHAVAEQVSTSGNGGRKADAAVTAALDGAVDGEKIYFNHCAACHGESREGDIGPNLVDEHTKRSVSGTAALIKNPPPAMPRLFPEPLSEADVQAAASYLHTRP